MNICADYCLMPGTVRIEKSGLRIRGPHGDVSVSPGDPSSATYRGTGLVNGSAAVYAAAMLREARRMAAVDCGWTLDGEGRQRITDHRRYYEAGFRPDCSNHDAARLFFERCGGSAR